MGLSGTDRRKIIGFCHRIGELRATKDQVEGLRIIIKLFL